MRDLLIILKKVLTKANPYLDEAPQEKKMPLDSRETVSTACT